jgi:multidrug resistance efflux pump
MTRLAAAEREASRVGPQVADGALPSSEADTAGDRVNELRAELEAARAAVLTATARVAADEFEIAQHSVRAPLDGRIVRRSARPGDGVSTLNVTPLFLFAPDGPRIVRADLDERFVERVRPGQRVEIVIENEDTAPRVLGGQVLRVGEVFGERSNLPEPGERVDVRAVECVFSLDDQTLRIGQRVMARVLP